ncbi:MAG: hypothetical protein AAF149_15795 [Bacteroidota bacterium]
MAVPVNIQRILQLDPIEQTSNYQYNRDALIQNNSKLELIIQNGLILINR